jgi:hypothetical protein
MMDQSPLPPAPDIFDQPAQPDSSVGGIPIVLRAQSNLLYPRWWLLSAIACCPLALLVFILSVAPLPCSFLCQAATLPDVVQFWGAYLLILLVFSIGRLVAMSLGLRAIEAPDVLLGRTVSRIAGFFRNISQFESIRWLLATYGGLAVVLVIVQLFLHIYNPITFALATVVVWVSYCTISHKPFQSVPQLTVDEQKKQNIDRLLSPVNVLRTRWPIRYVFPPRPVTGAVNFTVPGGGMQQPPLSNTPYNDE